MSDETQMVPRDRLNELKAKYESQIADLSAQLNQAAEQNEKLASSALGYKELASRAEAHEAKAKELEAQLSAANTARENDRLLYSAGITEPDQIEYVNFQASKSDKPFGEFLEGFKQSPLYQSLAQKPEAPAETPEVPAVPEVTSAPEAPAIEAPKANNGVKPDVSGGNLSFTDIASIDINAEDFDAKIAAALNGA